MPDIIFFIVLILLFYSVKFFANWCEKQVKK